MDDLLTIRRRRSAVLFALASLAHGCGDAAPDAPSSSRSDIVTSSQSELVPARGDLLARRSLAITDVLVLQRFTLQRTLEQIVATSGVAGVTARDLFRQWWDTQNVAPGIGLGPHCDDEAGLDSGPTLNGYPLTCRAAPAEGAQASCDPFADGSPCAYFPVGLFMRFDLAPEDGSSCGEYRIVFAKNTGKVSPTDRNLVIFEAALQNPHANQGLRGCQKFVDAWAALSAVESPTARAAQLEALYFTGWKEFDPVVSAANFGDNPGGFGQVRTNQFVQPNSPRIWSLREFKIKRDCAAAPCTLRFVPVTDKVNPFGPLFDARSLDANAPAFRADFLTQVASLAAPSLSAITMHTPEVLDSAQSQANGTSETNYLANFGAGSSVFRDAIQGALTRIGSALAPEDIVARAQAMACAGCHKLSSGAALGGQLTWPMSLGFTHVSERDQDLETVGGQTSYRISPALIDVLLPARKAIVEDYLNEVPRPSRGPKVPLGGRWVH